MQSPNNPSVIKVKLSISIVAIAALFGAMILPFFFRRTQKPTQLIQQIDIAPLNQAISELTREIHGTKLVIEQMQKAQEKPTTNTKSEEEIERLHLKKLFSFKYHKPFEVQQIIISIIGFGAVIFGLYFTYIQIKENGNTLDLTINQNIMSHTLDVDKLFVDSPDLRPYFFDGKDISPSDKNYNKALERRSRNIILEYRMRFTDAD